MPRSNVSTILRDLYTPVPLSAFPAHAVRLLTQAVDVDAKGTAELDYSTTSFTALREPAVTPAEQEKLNQIFLAHVAPHPLAASPAQVVQGMEMILSRTVGPRRFEKSPLFNEFYRPLAVRDEAGISICAGPARALCFYTWRDARSFTARDLETFAFLRPHVQQAYQNADALARACGGPSLIEDLGEALARGLVLLDRDCRVREWSDRGRRLMQTYFPTWRCEPHRLPEPLSKWVCRLLAQESDRKAPARLREAFQVAGAAGRLTIRLVNRRADGEFLVIFEEQQDAPPPSVLSALGLTPRECIIASWLAQGKTNPEIATILDANILTIKVHLLHIFEKLGVETRTAAAMRIVECWHGA